MPYSLLSLGPDSQTFINGIIASNKGRSAENSIALAKAIIDNLDIAIPTETTESPMGYFNLHYSIYVKNLLSSINEIIVLDLDMVYDLVKKFYMFKYNTVFDSRTNMFNGSRVIADFFGITKAFDILTLEIIVENYQFINNAAFRYAGIFKEMKIDPYALGNDNG